MYAIYIIFVYILYHIYILPAVLRKNWPVQARCRLMRNARSAPVAFCMVNEMQCARNSQTADQNCLKRRPPKPNQCTQKIACQSGSSAAQAALSTARKKGAPTVLVFIIPWHAKSHGQHPTTMQSQVSVERRCFWNSHSWMANPPEISPAGSTHQRRSCPIVGKSIMGCEGSATRVQQLQQSVNLTSTTVLTMHPERKNPACPSSTSSTLICGGVAISSFWSMPSLRNFKKDLSFRCKQEV